MSEADPLPSLEALLADLPAAVEQRRLGDSLARAVAALRTAPRQTERVEASLGLAADLGYGIAGAQAETVAAVRDGAWEVGHGLETAETTTVLDRAVHDYEHDFASALANLDRNVRQHWSAVAAEQFRPMVAIGDLLTRIKPDSDLGARLAACGRAAQMAPASLSGRPLRDHVSGLLRERAQLQDRRREALGEGDVAVFVNALADDRASLAMVTEAVRAWLADNRALDKLKVSPRL